MDVAALTERLHETAVDHGALRRSPRLTTGWNRTPRSWTPVSAGRRPDRRLPAPGATWQRPGQHIEIHAPSADWPRREIVENIDGGGATSHGRARDFVA